MLKAASDSSPPSRRSQASIMRHCVRYSIGTEPQTVRKGCANLDRDSPAIELVITFRRRRGMDVQAFRDDRRDVCAPVLRSIPEADLMRRRVASYSAAPRASEEEQRFDALVELWFDTEHDMTAMFGSDGFRTKVDPDHANFIDPTSDEQVVTEEVVFIEG